MKRHRIIRSKRQRIAYTNTSTIPDADLVAALKWLTGEVNLDRVIVHAKHAGRGRRSWGMAYNGIPAVTNADGLTWWDWDYLITLTDAGGDRWRDTLAHEARHIDQFRRGATNFERDARAFASWAALRMPT